MRLITHTTPTPLLTGQHLIHADLFNYPPAVAGDDLLLVDFDQRTIAHDGLFLLQRHDRSGAVAWIGCRRFEVSITDGLLVDFDGRGEMKPYKATDGAAIVGRVMKVYRSAGNL